MAKNKKAKKTGTGAGKGEGTEENIAGIPTNAFEEIKNTVKVERKPEPEERREIRRLSPWRLEEILHNLSWNTSMSQVIIDETWNGIKNELHMFSPYDASEILLRIHSNDWIRVYKEYLLRHKKEGDIDAALSDAAHTRSTMKDILGKEFLEQHGRLPERNWGKLYWTGRLACTIAYPALQHARAYWKRYFAWTATAAIVGGIVMGIASGVSSCNRNNERYQPTDPSVFIDEMYALKTDSLAVDYNGRRHRIGYSANTDKRELQISYQKEGKSVWIGIDATSHYVGDEFGEQYNDIIERGDYALYVDGKKLDMSLQSDSDRAAAGEMIWGVLKTIRDTLDANSERKKNQYKPEKQDPQEIQKLFNDASGAQGKGMQTLAYRRMASGKPFAINGNISANKQFRLRQKVLT